MHKRLERAGCTAVPLQLLAVVAISLALPALARATTYYVSPTGSDLRSGTSPGSAWQTVGKVNSSPLKPGDSVLFEAGKAFKDAALAPSGSGSQAAPIAFGSYGTGRATISGGASLTGRSYLTLGSLRLTSAVRGTADNITLDNDQVALPAGNSSVAITADGTNWTIAGNTISGAGGSGISLTGSGFTVKSNSIIDTGSNQSVSGARNGITDAAANTTIAGNVIQDFWNTGIWVDAHGSTIKNNYIANSGGYTTASSTNGIVWQQDDQTAGTSTWSVNTIAGTTGSDIVVAPGSGSVKENFVIGGNSLLRFSGSYMTISPTSGTCQCSQAANPALGISSGTTYYVASWGDDRNAGTTPTAPWKTIGEVDSPSNNHPGLALKAGDVVLFHAAQTFGDTTIDAESGAAGEPIVYGSWGQGQAVIAPSTTTDGVWLSGVHDVVVQDLNLDGGASPSADSGIYSHDGKNDCSDGLCSYDIVIDNCTIRHWFEGVHTGPADHDWTVEYSEIDHTSDNGIFFDRAGSGPYYGSIRMNALYNRISDTGLNPPDHPHAIYDDSTSSLVIGNRIARFGDGKIPSSGISVRFTRSVVLSNTIDGGGILHGNGIDLYDYDSGAGCTAAHPCPALWAYNRIVNVAGNGIYVDYHYGPNVCGASCPPQKFTIVNNTIIMAATASAGTAMIDFEYPVGSLTLANNIGTGSAPYDLGLEDDQSTCPIGAAVPISESHNDWSNALPDKWQYCHATYSTLSAYQSTGLGASDLNAPPQVDSHTFALAPTSPAIDAGTASVPGAPAYQPICPGGRFDYCGAAPDMGAVESNFTPARTRAPRQQHAGW